MLEQFVRASVSSRESPEYCPQPVYKRYCAEKVPIKSPGLPSTLRQPCSQNLWESKVPTLRAYGVTEIPRWVPAQVSASSLDRGSKLRGVIGCVKTPHGG